MKKPTLQERVREAMKVHKGPCVKARGKKPFQPCAVLAGVLACDADQKSGFVEAPSCDTKTGKWSNTLAYFPVKTRNYAVVTHCPFCGQAVR